MGEHIKWIIQMVLAVATFVGAVAAIARPIRAMIKAQKAYQAQTKARDDNIESRLKELERHQLETYLSTLRLTVVSDDMPLSERVAAGKKYLDENANGETKVRHEQNVAAYKRELEQRDGRT